MLTHIYLNNTYFLPTHIQVKWKILSFVISSSCFIILHLNFQIETENVIFAIIETVHKTVILISLLWYNQHNQSINEKYQLAKWKVVIEIKLSIIEIMIEACKFSWFQMIHFVSSCSKPWAVFNHFVFLLLIFRRNYENISIFARSAKIFNKWPSFENKTGR